MHDTSIYVHYLLAVFIKVYNEAIGPDSPTSSLNYTIILRQFPAPHKTYTQVKGLDINFSEIFGQV